MNIEQHVLIILIDTNLGPTGCLDFTLPLNTSLLKTKFKEDYINSETISFHLNFKDILQAICYFIRTYELLSDCKRLLIIAMNNQKCGIIYEDFTQNHYYDLTLSTRFNKLEQRLQPYLQTKSTSSGSSMLATSFSISLCYMNRIQKESTFTYGQILIIDASKVGDYSSQYIPLMNASFTASKHDITVDVCALRPNSSTILQQLVDMTGGTHIYFPQAIQTSYDLNYSLALSEILLFHFLPSKTLRKVISTIKQQDRTNTAVCFCHHQPVEICTVCSCCLAIYCSDIDDETGKERIHCQVCKARFTRFTIQQKMATDILTKQL